MNKWLAKAKELDEADPLKQYRDQFVIADPNLIYFDGNSLGRQPIATAQQLDQVIKQEWGEELINSWNKSWYNKSIEIGNKIAQIIGAEEGEVIVSDNTSTNLYKLAWAALNFQQKKNVIITDEFNFPSDIYILEGLARQFSRQKHMKFMRSDDGISIADDALEKHIDSDTALVTLSHVAFKSAFMYDMEKVTKLAHDHGAMMLWDLSHSTGAVPLRLNKCHVDMAVGCTYKYLNGGPGAPAFLYVRKELQEKLSSPIQGWFGADLPFDFSLKYAPASGIRKFLSGTPPIISLAAIEQGVDQLIATGMDGIRAKSVKMSCFFRDMFQEELVQLGFKFASPSHVEQRGSHISIQHQFAFQIAQALKDETIDGFSVIPDFREPNNIRFGFAPLYNSYEELYFAIMKLKRITSEKLYVKYNNTSQGVT